MGSGPISIGLGCAAAGVFGPNFTEWALETLRYLDSGPKNFVDGENGRVADSYSVVGSPAGINLFGCVV
jgi:hypothetical protein